MAKNFKYSGKRIHITSLSADVSSGALTREQGFIGIPLNNALAGTTVAFALQGVWGMTWDFYGTSQPVAGTILYWDTTAGALSLGSANDDYAAVKVITTVSSTDGSFDGLLLPQTRPVGQDQS